MNYEGLTDRFSDQIRSVAPSCEKFNQSNSDFPLSSSGGLKRSNDRVFLKGKKSFSSKTYFFPSLCAINHRAFTSSFWRRRITLSVSLNDKNTVLLLTEWCLVPFEKPSLSRCRTHGTATLNSLQNSILMSKQLIYSKSTRRDKTSVRRSEMEPTAGCSFSNVIICYFLSFMVVNRIFWGSVWNKTCFAVCGQLRDQTINQENDRLRLINNNC